MKKILLNRMRLKAGIKHYALVDDEDYDFLSQFNWYLTSFGYAAKRCPYSCKIEKMHRFMAGLSDRNIQVDHIDCNKLNNQKSNLRPASNSQNQRNTVSRGASMYKGVSWCNTYKKWRAAIKSFGVSFHIGMFVVEIEAAKAYDAAAIIHHGEFARLNFPKRNLTNSK